MLRTRRRPPATPAPATPAPQPSSPAASDEPVLDGTDAEDVTGSVTVGTTSILPPPPEGLTPFRGRTAQVTAIPVQQIVAGAGFWIGPSESTRLFVLTSAETDASAALANGVLVSFEADVVANADDVTDYGLDPGTGEDLLGEQGSHLEVVENAAIRLMPVPGPSEG